MCEFALDFCWLGIFYFNVSLRSKFFFMVIKTNNYAMIATSISLRRHSTTSLIRDTSA